MRLYQGEKDSGLQPKASHYVMERVSEDERSCHMQSMERVSQDERSCHMRSMERVSEDERPIKRG